MIAMRAHKIQLQLDFFSVFNAIISNVIAPSVSLITLTDLFVGRGGLMTGVGSPVRLKKIITGDLIAKSLYCTP